MSLARIIAITLFAVSGQDAAAQVCGSPGEKAHVSVTKITLSALPASPRFYYRADRYVVLIGQDQLRDYLRKPGTMYPSASMTLAGMVSSDMPLKRDQDLFAYNFVDWQLWAPIESVVMDLVSSGKVAVVDLGGNPIPFVTLVRDAKPGGVLRRAFAGKRGVNEMLWRVDCIAD
jgi:hypothetical protein